MSLASGWIRQLLASSLARQSAAVLALGLAAKGVVFLREVAVAAQFGVSPELDAFVIAWMVTSSIITFLFATLGTAVVPTLIRLRRRDAEARVNGLFSSILLLGSLLMALVVLAVGYGAEWYLPFLTPGLADSQRRLAHGLLWWLAPSMVAHYFASMFGAYLLAQRDHGLYTTYIALPAAATIAAIAFLPADPPIYNLVVGANVGLGLAAVVMWWRAKGHGLRLSWQAPRSIRSDRLVRHALRQWLPLIFASLLAAVNIIVDRAMASSVGVGSVALIDYGSKAAGIFGTLAMTTLSTVFYPFFSERIAERDFDRLRSSFIKSNVLIAAGSILVLVAVLLFSRQIAGLLFERGAFTAADTPQVARLLLGYTLGLPFQLCGTLGVRLLSSLNMNYLVSLLAVVSMGTNILLNLLFLRWFGLFGLALSTSTVYAIVCALVFLAIYRRLYRPGKSTAAVPVQSP